jgi:hypothetical protein
VQYQLNHQTEISESIREKGLTLVLFLDEIPHVTWRDFTEELDIIIGVKLCHLAFRGRLGTLQVNTR